uniref:Uncharacterized protein n=1 Tax=Arion vulgaris TaxID=1028688 RepID=A0A0B7BX68_9EUPU
MKLTPSTKIAIGWSVIISVGLSAFVVARGSVTNNRKAIMDTKRRIKDQAQKEGEAKFDKHPVQSGDTINS